MRLLGIVAAAVGLLGMTGCMSSAGGSGSSAEGGSCEAFCAQLAQGESCGSAKQSCMQDCQSVSQACPARAPEMLSCLSELQYQCVSTGYVVALSRGAPASSPETLSGHSGSISVQDPACAELVNEFLDCKPATTGGGTGGAPGAGGQPSFGGSPGSGSTGGVGGFGGAPTGAGGASLDLGDVYFDLSASIVSTSGSFVTLEICANETGDVGEYVQVGNMGATTLSQPFSVALGVIREQDQTVFPASDLLTSDVTLNPGEYAVWSGSFCTYIDVVKAPGMTYSLFVFADPNDSLLESDENNNAAFTDSFTL